MSELHRDPDGQPVAPVNFRRTREKTLNELYGLCEGILADRVLVTDEIVFLADWLSSCTLSLNEWPAGVIAQKVAHILDDGEITMAEADELTDLLSKAIGGSPGKSPLHRATRLPCDEIAPVRFVGRTFCFTGKFQYGDRKICQSMTAARGGRIQKDVTRDLNYLVIGTLASRDWISTNHGRKIEAAVTNKQNGAPTQIVSEEHWLACLGGVNE